MSSLEWRQSTQLIPYPEALEIMQARVTHIHDQHDNELVWLLEHPPLYTAGTSAKKHDLIDAGIIPVYQTGRGGQFTYHGPGQRIAYVMIDLEQRQKDLRAFVYALEQWIIDTLRLLDVKGERRPGRVGIWIKTTGGEEKIAAIGVRIRKWVTFHGIAINVNPNLDHYLGIVPCGLPEFGITSLEKLGIKVSLQELDILLQQTWHQNAFLSPTTFG